MFPVRPVSSLAPYSSANLTGLLIVEYLSADILLHSWLEHPSKAEYQSYRRVSGPFPVLCIKGIIES